MPTINERLRKRALWMSSDDTMLRAAQERLGSGWELESGTDLEDFGDWQEILLRRFLILQLDDPLIPEPVEVIDTLRREYQLNIPIFCHGGDADIQMAARSARADRFFAHDEILAKLEEFARTLGW